MQVSTSGLLRWGAIVSLAGLALTILVSGLSHLSATFSADWVVTTLTIGCVCLLSALPLSFAVVLYRREYRFLISGTCFIASLAVFAFLMWLPVGLELESHLRDLMHSSGPSDWRLLLAISVYLFLGIVVPFWASNRFLKFTLRHAGHWLESREARNQGA